MRHLQPTDEIREQAVLYTLGALDAAEAGSFESHLAEGCPTCERETQAFAGVVCALAHASSPEHPGPELRARVLGAIGADVTGIRTSIVVRASDARWEATATPGMETRRLFVDPARARATVLVRMGASAQFPAHRHSDTEELYVLDGALIVGDQLLSPGDYCVVTAGATYGPLRSQAGCTYFMFLPEGDTVAPAEVGSFAGPSVIRSGEGPWRDGPARGVSIRRLFADPGRKTVTAHVRMEPGARLPGHGHLTAEQVYLLHGGAHVGGDVLQAGDFSCAPSGSPHDITSTAGGCELLVLASGAEVLA